MSRPRHTLVGHAIVSADGLIADEKGRFPPALRIEADQRRFQAALDAADVTLIGRLGHEAHGNPKGRRRLVLTRQVPGLEEGARTTRAPGRTDFLNPQGMPLEEALDLLFPQGAYVAVVGGTAIFDHVLAGPGFARFELVTAGGVHLGAGRPCFGEQGPGGPEALLEGLGYRAANRSVLDPAGPVTLCVFSRG